MTVALGCYPLYDFLSSLALRIQLLVAVRLSFVHTVFFFFFLILAVENFVFWLICD